MIKLVNLLKEIDIKKPVPTFKTNDELAKYMKLDSSFKKNLINTIWYRFNPDWDGEVMHNVLNGWYNAPIVQYSTFNEEDEIMLDDGEDNRLYISIHSMVSDPTSKEYQTNLGKNTFYWQYY